MKLKSIRTRLTAWYLAVLAAGLIILALSSWYGMRAIVIGTVDEELLDRISDIEKLLDQPGPSTSLNEAGAALLERFRLAPPADLVQVSDEQGNWLYRSPALEHNEVRLRALTPLGREPVFEVLRLGGEPIRFATARVSVRGHIWIVQVAESIQELAATLDRFGLLLRWLIPGLLALAGAGGYWISRRALQPVDRITAAAESISIHNLGGQLSVPRSGDELQRLSETLNRMLARLNESVQRISQFTADASHELRSPLSIIRTTAELAVQGQRSGTELQEDMMIILAEAERVTRLIDSLLLLARADAGQDGLQRELTDLPTILRQAVEQCRAPADKKKLDLHCSPGDAPLAVMADAEAMRRLFVILVDNAVKYTPGGGQIDVRLEASGEWAIVRVTDTGIGIADKDLPYIFDRFWRADKVRSRGMGGAGLGLSIARWISDRHQWSIHARAMPGGGTQFTVTIPLVTGKTTGALET
jgi:signal transduction histidine kinase